MECLGGDGPTFQGGTSSSPGDISRKIVGVVFGDELDSSPPDVLRFRHHNDILFLPSLPRRFDLSLRYVIIVFVITESIG